MATQSGMTRLPIFGTSRSRPALAAHGTGCSLSVHGSRLATGGHRGGSGCRHVRRWNGARAPRDARVDAELTRAMRSVAGVVASEINERRDLRHRRPRGTHRAELPGVGVLACRFIGPLARDADVRSSCHRCRTRGLGPRRRGTPHARAGDASERQPQPQHGPDAYTIVTWMSLGTFDREHATVMNTVRIAIPFAALAALTGGWLMVWRALRPLSVTAAQADGMDPRHLQARLPLPPPPDSFAALPSRSMLCSTGSRHPSTRSADSWRMPRTSCALPCRLHVRRPKSRSPKRIVPNRVSRGARHRRIPNRPSDPRRRRHVSPGARRCRRPTAAAPPSLLRRGRRRVCARRRRAGGIAGHQHHVGVTGRCPSPRR